MKRPKLLLIMDAIDATTTSDPIDIEGTKRIQFEFTRSNHTSGNTVYSVSFSVDGVTYVTANKLIDNVANTNAQTLTRVASATLSSSTSKHYAVDLQHDYFKWMKVTATRTTDGKATVKALLELES